MSQRIPISPRSPKGAICFSTLLIAVNLPPPPTSHYHICLPSMQISEDWASRLFPMPASYLWISHKHSWHPLWEITAKDHEEATSRTRWENGDINGRKGHMLHLKNQHSECSCQLKRQHSQGASFHVRKGMSLMKCPYTSVTDATQLPGLSRSLRLYAKSKQVFSSSSWLERQVQWL